MSSEASMGFSEAINMLNALLCNLSSCVYLCVHACTHFCTLTPPLSQQHSAQLLKMLIPHIYLALLELVMVWKHVPAVNDTSSIAS